MGAYNVSAPVPKSLTCNKWSALYCELTETYTRLIVFDPKQLDDLTDRLVGLLPKGVVDMQKDVEKNMRAMLQSTFAKMDLVTREEFDVQTAVLARTREKLEKLEKQIAELESKYSQQ